MPLIKGPLSTPLLVLAASATVAAAQPAAYDRGHNEGVRDRDRPDYAAAGMPLGAFRLFPTLGLSVSSDDNIYATQTGEISDTIGTADADLALRSQWSRHQLNVDLGATRNEYEDISAESTTDWHAGADGRLEILRGFDVRANAAYREGHEARGANDPTLDPLRAPIEVEQSSFGGSVTKEFGRVRVMGGASSVKYDYRDGTRASGLNFDQDFRDETLNEWDARADLALSPSTSFFVSYADRDHDFDQGARDFTAQQALIGAGFDITHLIRGEIGVGYVWTDFDNAAMASVDGGSLNARIDWFITQLTTINVHASRDVTDSGIAAASSIEQEAYGARVDHELRRNILLVAQGDYAKDEYKGIDRTDERTSFSLGADWLVNRWATLGARVSHDDQTSSGLNRDRDFDRTRATIALTLKR